MACVDEAACDVRRGGHCGFLQGLWPFGAAWSDEVMVEFFGCMLAHEGAAAALQACKAAAAPPPSAAAERSKSRSIGDFMHLSSTKVWGRAVQAVPFQSAQHK